jgi:hypothetical protein
MCAVVATLAAMLLALKVDLSVAEYSRQNRGRISGRCARRDRGEIFKYAESPV